MLIINYNGASYYNRGDSKKVNILNERHILPYGAINLFIPQALNEYLNGYLDISAQGVKDIYNINFESLRRAHRYYNRTYNTIEGEHIDTTSNADRNIRISIVTINGVLDKGYIKSLNANHIYIGLEADINFNKVKAQSLILPTELLTIKPLPLHVEIVEVINILKSLIDDFTFLFYRLIVIFDALKTDLVNERVFIVKTLDEMFVFFANFTTFGGPLNAEYETDKIFTSVDSDNAVNSINNHIVGLLQNNSILNNNLMQLINNLENIKATIKTK